MTAHDTWQRARSLARRQWDNEAIVGDLVEHGMDEAAAEDYVRRGHAALERAREQGKGELRSRTWSIAFGEDTCDAQQWQALYALGRAHLGYGETHDVAQLREWIRKGKAAAKGADRIKRELKAVG